MISVLVPALNEERYLPALLSSLKGQGVEMEIIVADSDSRDRTREIARKAGCKVTGGGRYARGINRAAALAKGDLILTTADTVFPKGFLKGFLARIEKDDACLATCMVRPTTNVFSHRLFYWVKNNANYFDRWPVLHVSSQCIFVRRDAFRKAGGFDETLFLGEEHDFADRAKKYGRFLFFRDLYVLNSPRRLEREGTPMMFFKTIYSEICRLFRPKLRKEIYRYEYGKF